MNWVNYIYIYQPPTQKKDILQKVMDQSYRPILNLLLENPQSHININVNAGLIEMFSRNNGDDIIEKLKALLNRGQIEISETSAYQAFLPMIPKDEIKRQIQRNHSIMKSFLGDNYQPQGFFSPSMAYTDTIFNIVKEFGYKWIILDENVLKDRYILKHDRIYTHDGLNIFIRDRAQSFKIMSYNIDNNQELITDLNKTFSQEEFLITAIDGETFGHHRVGYERILFYIYNSNKINSYLLSDIPDIIDKKEEIQLQESSWILPSKNEGIFERWYSKNNLIQKKQYELLNLAIKTIQGSKYRIDDPQIVNKDIRNIKTSEKTWLQSRYLLDEAMYQDQFFFSSARPAWSMDLIEKGAYLLSEVVRLTPDADKFDKNKSRKLYQDIVLTGIKWQKENTITKMVKQFFEDERPEQGESLAPKLSHEEYLKVLKRLTINMKNSAKAEDYDIAQSFKERINELKKNQES